MAKLVAFDLWKTLAQKGFSTAEAIRREFCPQSGLRNRYFAKLFEEVTQTTEWRSMEEMADSLLRKLGAESTKGNIERVIDIVEGAEGNFFVYPHVLPMLKSLKVHGYVTALVSNSNVFSAEYVRERSGIMRHMDYQVFSFEVGAIKPDKAIFKALLERSGCEPWETVMVGDDADDDIAPAKELGMKAVLYEDYSQLKGELEKLGVHV
jgi:HAD superfamily hydrolase (TIGR01509 family)